METKVRIKDPQKIKLTKSTLNTLSYKKAGELQVSKNKKTGVTEYYYFSEPYRGSMVKNILATWKRGIATVPKDWI